MKNKNKTYKKKLTKHRKEKRKWYTLGVTVLVAVCTLLIAKQGVEAEIILLDTPQITVERPVEDTRTLEEHVWDLLTKEGGLSFNEAMIGMEIVTLESRWDKYAISDTGDYGLWQINLGYHDIGKECAFDVYCSTREAVKIYKSWGNWTAWVTYNKYLKS